MKTYTGGLPQQPNTEDKFIDRVIKLIEKELDNPDFGPDELADGIHLSVSQLYRKLKFLTGKSTSIFIRWVRLQHSLEMLQSKDKNVSEVAYSCGFKDPSWFSRAFKKEFGFPPSAVIK